MFATDQCDRVRVVAPECVRCIVLVANNLSYKRTNTRVSHYHRPHLSNKSGGAQELRPMPQISIQTNIFPSVPSTNGREFVTFEMTMLTFAPSETIQITQEDVFSYNLAKFTPIYPPCATITRLTCQALLVCLTAKQECIGDSAHEDEKEC